MNLDTLAALRKYAQPGETIEISLRDQKVIGTLKEFTETGLIVESSEGILFIHSSAIESFFIRQSVPRKLVSVSEAAAEDAREEGAVSSDATASPSLLIQAEENKGKESAISRYAFDRFRPDPVFQLPVATFDLPGMERDEQQDLNRWRNKLQYAEKVREISRISGFIPEMIRWAERLRDSSAHLLCGLLALRAGMPKEAHGQFVRACALGSADAALCLASLAIQEQNWQLASNVLLGYFLESEQPTGRIDVLISLGSCLARCSEHEREVRGLASIRVDVRSSDALETRNLILAYALQSRFPDAARAAFEGDLPRASTLAQNSPVFSPPLKLDRVLGGMLAATHPVLPPDQRQKQKSSEPTETFGHISGIYPEKSYGFITDNAQNTFFFHFSDIDDAELERDFKENRSGQIVSFVTFYVRPDGAKYDAAHRVRLIELPDSSKSTDGSGIGLGHRTATKAVNLPLPKDDLSYAEAKKAENSGDLHRAEQLLRKVIDAGGKYSHSAIKDLAQLLSRLDRGQEALDLLEKHRSKLSGTKALDNQRAYILVRMRRYDEAASTFKRLELSASPREKAQIIRQQAYCILMSGGIGDSLNLLYRLQRQEPNDRQTIQMIERIEMIGASGTSDDADLEGLAGLSSGISILAQEVVNACDFTGVDERSKARGFFTPQDFREVESGFEKARGRRPSHKAKLLVTLAAMAQRSPEAVNNRSPRLYLGRALCFMGEAATYENTHPDTARCYLAEALNLIRGSDVDIRFPLAYLLSTYLSIRPAPGDLLASENKTPKMFYDVRKVLASLERERLGWESFLVVLPYYAVLSSDAIRFLADEIHASGSSLLQLFPNESDLAERCDRERERLRTERVALGSWAKASYTSASNFQEAARALLEVRDATRFQLDRQRLDSLVNIANEASLYWQEQDYIEREARLVRLANGLEVFEQDVKAQPTKMSFELLAPLARHVRRVLVQHFDEYKENTQPVLSLSNVLTDDYYYIQEDGTITVSLELASVKGGAPVEGIDVNALEEQGLRVVEPGQSPELLRGGDRRQVEVRIRPSEEQIRDQAFTIRCYLTYRTRSGTQRRSEDFPVPVRIGEVTQFQLIQNPFQRYSGGKSVEDPEMFKGREALLERVTEVIAKGPIGQCFVLYGQKRSGKTSVLKQLRIRLGRPCLAIEITAGVLDVIKGETNFAQACLDHFAKCMRDELGVSVDPSCWPSRQRTREEPMGSLTAGIDLILGELRKLEWQEARLVLLIDEFTYIYELIKEGIISASFMKNWKALLQMQLFSAVVAGQDSMPLFKQAFQNEFGSTFDERVSYLSFEEAAKLAEEPILLDGRSRYRGHALDRLLELTAGSPFYTHILCDRLVSHLNSRRAPFITEADIERVATTLTSGGDALPIERFDPLITAASESVAQVPRGTYLRILKAISSRRGGCLLSELPEISGITAILKDLQERDVIMIDAGRRYSIRVGLFSEWLMVNEDLSGGAEAAL